jgi:phage terminase large subunit GpA-like protein
VILPRGKNAKPGPLELFPFQVEPVDCPLDPDVESMTLMFASQLLGKTLIETVILGSRIDQDPCGIMQVFPTHQMAQDWSKTKLQDMIDTTPSLQEKIGGPNRGQKRGKKGSGIGNSTIQLKLFPGGFLVMGGANSPSGLASYTCGVVSFDEVDRYPASAGVEGDPLGVAGMRTETFSDAFQMASSTPTVKGFSRIEIQYESTDKRKWFVKCENPACPQPEFVIMWSHIVWDKRKDESGRTLEHFPETARIECPACGHRHDEKARLKMVRGGRWVATNPTVKRKRGYWANAFLCLLPKKKGYVGWLHRWAEEFLNKCRKGPEVMKTLVNTVFCESFEEESEKPTAPEILYARREDYIDPGHPPEDSELPKEVLCLTCAFDVQGNRVEGQIIGWGNGEEAWPIDYHVFLGNTELTSFWQEVDDWVQRKWKHPSGKTLQPASVAIDANYLSRRVYAFVKKCQPRRVFAVRGVGSDMMPWINRSRTKSILYNLNVDAGKNAMFSRLNMKEAGPGYLHFPITFDLTYFEQLTAERIVTTYSYGMPVKHFVLPGGKRNEAWDTLIYNLAALELLRPNWKALERLLGIDSDEPPSRPEKTEDVEQIGNRRPLNPTARSRINAARRYMGGWK